MSGPPTSESDDDNFVEPPSPLRCRRSDGQKWRCRQWRIHEKQLCQRHYLQILAKSGKRKSPTPVRAPPRVSKMRSENSKATSISGGGRGGAGGGSERRGGFAVYKSKRLGLSVAGGKNKRNGERGSEASSSEEVMPKKKPRSKTVLVEDEAEKMDEDDNNNEEGEEEEEEEEEKRVNLGKNGRVSTGKVEKIGKYRNEDSDVREGRGNVVRSGKKGCENGSSMNKKKAEKDEDSDKEGRRGNFPRSDKRGAKNAFLMKKKEVKRKECSDMKEDSDQEVGSFLKRAKRSSVLLLDEKKNMKKVLRDEGSNDHEEEINWVKNSKKGKTELERTKKKAEVKEETEKEDASIGELIKRSGGVKLGNENKKVVLNSRGDEQEKRRHNVATSMKMKGKVDVGKEESTDEGETSDDEKERIKIGKSGKRYSDLEFRWKEKRVESSEETEEDEVEKGRELTRVQNSGGLKWEKNERKVLTKGQNIAEGRRTSAAFKHGNWSVQFEQGKEKKCNRGTTSDEDEEANEKRVDKRGSQLVGDEVSTGDEEERGKLKSDESSDGFVTAMERQKIRGNNEADSEEDERGGVSKRVEMGEEVGLRKTKKTLVETKTCDQMEGGTENLKGTRRAKVVKTLKTKGCRAKTVQMGINTVLDEQKNWRIDSCVNDGDGDDSEKKSQLRGKSKEVKGMADEDSEDGGTVDFSETKCNDEARKVEMEGCDGDHVDGSEEMGDDCLLKVAKKNLKPEAFSKRENMKVSEKKGKLPETSKLKTEKNASSVGTFYNENICFESPATKKSEKASKVDLQSGERRGRGLKVEKIGGTKGEVVKNTDECTNGVPSVRGRSGVENSRPKVDRRRKHFSTDVSFMAHFFILCM